VLEAIDLTKQFTRDGTATIALRGFNLSIEQGAFTTILGRSGCGKSTMLNLLSGLTRPTAGQVRYSGRPHTGPTVDIGYLTQADTLLPWLDAQRNVELPLELQGVGKDERQQTALGLINKVGLAGFEKSYPRELSGGMRRRASLARMLAGGAQTLLMDEPFGALDAQLRSELQEQLLTLWQGTGATVVFVTHDIEEAILMGDRVVVLGPLGTILRDVQVTIPRPRHVDDVRVDPVFVDLHRELARALREGSAS
jgi:NitT/TauT family transport system ATP-binding protein